jgi:hypothetical protein
MCTTHQRGSVSKGYVWGTDPEKLFQSFDRAIPAGDSSVDARMTEKNVFDVIILSDLIFNHSQVGNTHAHSPAFQGTTRLIVAYCCISVFSIQLSWIHVRLSFDRPG